MLKITLCYKHFNEYVLLKIYNKVAENNIFSEYLVHNINLFGKNAQYLGR